MDFHSWVLFGMTKGWCGPPVCATHDAVPSSEQEDEEFEMRDPCIHIVRLYEDDEMKKAVEAWHSPSVWRKNPYERT